MPSDFYFYSGDRLQYYQPVLNCDQPNFRDRPMRILHRLKKFNILINVWVEEDFSNLLTIINHVNNFLLCYHIQTLY